MFAKGTLLQWSVVNSLTILLISEALTCMYSNAIKKDE
jgi:hypothetical protein